MKTKIIVCAVLLFVAKKSVCKETPLVTWLSLMSDPTFECLFEQGQLKLKDHNENKLKIIETVDCDVSGARWDYKLKVSFFILIVLSTIK
jgi:hypothetical protein